VSVFTIFHILLLLARWCVRPRSLCLNHRADLDMQSIDALADALNNFSGGVVLVSHDFRLIDQVAKEVWVVDENKVSTWCGCVFAVFVNLYTSV
jgi:ATP-binding cassette subfamily F protein 2